MIPKASSAAAVPAQKCLKHSPNITRNILVGRMEGLRASIHHRPLDLSCSEYLMLKAADARHGCLAAPLKRRSKRSFQKSVYLNS